MRLIISVTIPVVIGFIGGQFSRPEIDSWYQSIEKPSWQPPNWVFGPVWTALYVLMGIALYLVWKSNAPEIRKRTAIILWTVQLVFNFFWSYIFFSLHELDWALAEIIVLWILILLTIFAFARISKLAAWLLVPYISWVSFASILTYTIYQFNQ